MRKAVFSMFVLCLMGCGEKGDTGAAGPAGPAGADGNGRIVRTVTCTATLTGEQVGNIYDGLPLVYSFADFSSGDVWVQATVGGNGTSRFYALDQEGAATRQVEVWMDRDNFLTIKGGLNPSVSANKPDVLRIVATSCLEEQY